MYYVLVVCDDDEDSAFLDQAFHARSLGIFLLYV